MAHVLIIDDEEGLRQLVRVVLERNGHTTEQAGDGSEGLRVCACGHFDVVLCDLMMPGREGLETIRDLRRLYPELPIVAMTGMVPGLSDPLSIASRLGATRTLTKPFRIEQLSRTITEVLAEPITASQGRCGNRSTSDVATPKTAPNYS